MKHFDDILEKITMKQAWRKEPVFNQKSNTLYTLKNKPVHVFCSNDYLGFVKNHQLKKILLTGIENYSCGSTGSHLVCGHFEIHQKLIEHLAEYTKRKSSLLFSSGYMANMSVISSLMGRHDFILSDRFNHASLNAAAKLSSARFLRYKHQDYQDLSRLLEKHQNHLCMIISDAVFSMEGTCANIQKLNELIKQYENAFLYIDDAHGFGVLGKKGNQHAQELVQNDRVIYMANFSKALGLSGAFVAGGSKLIEFLRQKSSGYIYTTALSPFLAYAADQALFLCEDMAFEREKLVQKIKYFRDGLSSMSFQLSLSNTPIQPLLIGENKNALYFSQRLVELGFWVQAIRPPSVPKNTARLRFTICADHSMDLINKLLNALDQIKNEK